MARKKGFTPKEKKTLTPKPDWEKLRKATTEEERIQAWLECDTFVHMEITTKEYLHSTKKWIRDRSGWDVWSEVVKIPDVFLAQLGKNGWKAYQLGYMPDKVKTPFKTMLFRMVEKSDKLRDYMVYEPPIHPTLEAFDDDDHMHPNKVKSWIDAWKKQLSTIDKEKDPARWHEANNYIYNMTTFLKTGVWLDTHVGEKRETRIYPISHTLAYDKNGIVKRTQGIYYPDIGRVWR